MAAKRDTLGSLVTMGNQVCRYTMLTRPLEPMLSAILGTVELRKCLFTRHPTMYLPRYRSSTMYTHIHTPTRSPYGPRVRRSTGEMLQSTRLKGQLTPSCLAARIVVALSAFPPYVCAPVPFFPLPVCSRCLHPGSAVLCPSCSFFFPPHFLRVHRVS